MTVTFDMKRTSDQMAYRFSKTALGCVRNYLLALIHHFAIPLHQLTLSDSKPAHAESFNLSFTPDAISRKPCCLTGGCSKDWA